MDFPYFDLVLEQFKINFNFHGKKIKKIEIEIKVSLTFKISRYKSSSIISRVICDNYIL